MARKSRQNPETPQPEADQTTDASRDDAPQIAPETAPETAPEPPATDGDGVVLAEPGTPGAPGPAAESYAEAETEAETETETGPPADPAPEGASVVEAVPERDPEPAVEASPGPQPYYPPPAPSGGSGGFVAGLLGGALAVAAGVGVLWLSNPDLLRGEAPAPDLSPVEARLDELAAADEALAAQLAEVRAALEGAAAPGDDGGEAAARIEAVEADLAQRIEALAAEVDRLSSSLQVLDGRLGQVEVRPPVMEGGAAEANAAAIAELRAALDAERAELDAAIAEARRRIDEATAEAEALRESAAAAQRATVARAAYSRLAAALEAGGPFAAALSDLGEVAEVSVPPELIAAADTGVATMDELRRSFPDAARAALAAALRAGVDAEAGAMERIGAFLRAQTGARSIAPREGDDPDAVLSRAEAALADGRLDDALSLIDRLPEPAQAEMAAWRAAAEERRAALAAADTLSAALPAN